MGIAEMYQKNDTPVAFVLENSEATIQFTNRDVELMWLGLNALIAHTDEETSILAGLQTRLVRAMQIEMGKERHGR